MIKRTGEKVLTWIGFILHTLYVIFLVLIQMMVSDSDFKEQLANELQKNPDSNVSRDQTIEAVNSVATNSSGWIMIGIVILGLTLVAAIMLSKHPTISAILLIIAVVLSVFNVSWVAGILWLIAAIMLLVRRPKNQYAYNSGTTTDIPPEENERYNNYSENHNDEYRHQQQDVEVDNHDHHQSHSTNDKDVSDDARLSNDDQHDDFVRDAAERRQQEKNDDPYKY
ncbi:DUF4064 domain-containing protein [Staphylococcus lugdunensis]|uniref:DUF4064 domain-containing protein n=1 Tax=Staphylococcus lugdunensis TaxID=28035 RepID=UPI00045B5733|nr:DUF4064 domain-containing protein [Staphylococcus lugdunensis]KAK55476.1 PF13273 family protein [Staphylococcus lugdunensis VCU150]MCI2846118.1 DUF4064 domain-containing protein [Staphylococcus lugdunensis]MDU4770334.1 DUF4064 domain-containing protein [Staphylococcus lugdunensis]